MELYIPGTISIKEDCGSVSAKGLFCCHQVKRDENIALCASYCEKQREGGKKNSLNVWQLGPEEGIDSLEAKKGLGLPQDCLHTLLKTTNTSGTNPLTSKMLHSLFSLPFQISVHLP